MEQDPATPDLCRSEEGLLYILDIATLLSEQELTSADLSLEFLMGRALDNAMLNVGLKDAAQGTQRV
jgi:glucan phosphorylase